MKHFNWWVKVAIIFEQEKKKSKLNWKNAWSSHKIRWAAAKKFRKKNTNNTFRHTNKKKKGADLKTLFLGNIENHWLGRFFVVVASDRWKRMYGVRRRIHLIDIPCGIRIVPAAIHWIQCIYDPNLSLSTHSSGQMNSIAVRKHTDLFRLVFFPFV